MSTYAADILNSLAAAAEKLNSDVLKAYPKGQAEAIWTEGGEWPTFSDDYRNFQIGKQIRDMSVTYESPGAIKAFDGFVDAKFRDNSVVGLTMECGSGKSTTAMLTLHNMKMGKRTIVVQPSIVVAQYLVQYLSNVSNSVYCAMDASQLPLSRALVYTGVGGFLDMLLRGKITDEDMVVIDESHCVTFVHTVVADILSRMSVPVLMMTASTSPVVRGLRGVKLVEVSSLTNDVSEHLSREPKCGLIVGVNDNSTYAAPANPFIGATIDLRVMYDTGLRAEPRVKHGAIVEGERRATVLEVIQMVGRLGRMNRGGTAYYNTKARVMDTGGTSLYDVMQRAMQSALKLDKGLDYEKAIKVWKISGLIGRRELPIVNVTPVPVDAPDEGRPVTADGTLIPETPNFTANGFGSVPIRESRSRGSSVSSFLSVASRPRVDSGVVSSDDDVDGFGSDLQRESSHGDSRYKSVYVTQRRYSNSKGDALKMKSLVKDTYTGELTSIMKPDSGWRPFRRADELLEREVSSDTGISNFVRRIQKAVDRGDMIYPAKFLRADRRVTTMSSRDDARRVLAGRLVPTFSEIEMLSVVLQWNDVCDCTSGAMAGTFVEQFVNYFTAYMKWSSLQQD